jgi:diaminopimelate epimerase
MASWQAGIFFNRGLPEGHVEMKVPFTKMTGIGNDYIYFDAITHEIPKDEIIKITPALSERRFGIGSDGAIFILPSSKADAKMEMYNADASRAEMCGNGLRCVVRYCLDRLFDKKQIVIETDSGLAKGWKTDNNEVCIEMFFPPKVSTKIETVASNGNSFSFTRVDVGNPHAVIEYKNIGNIPLDQWGPPIENNLTLFPNRVNTEFFEVVEPGHVKMRVWERGSGETFACGTGAAAVAAFYRHKTNLNQIKVSLLGGDLVFEWKDSKFYMTGPATFVADGTFDLEGWKK